MDGCERAITCMTQTDESIIIINCGFIAGFRIVHV